MEFDGFFWCFMCVLYIEVHGSWKSEFLRVVLRFLGFCFVRKWYALCGI